MLGQPEQQVCELSYNERDEIAAKKIGKTASGSFLQTVNYGYNIRGWLTSINNPKSLGNDLFGLSINHIGLLGVNYNGNITSKTWANSNDEIERMYDFSYDNLNRLTAANYSQLVPDVGSINSSSFTTSSDQFNTAYSYDRNGNIETLTRNGLTGGIFAQIDNLDYDYADDGALNSIAETSEKEHGFKSKTAGGTGVYTYDDNGNMLTDAHKEITVSYNFLNLPTLVTKGSESIEWFYDASGTKLSKTVISHSSLGNHIDVPNPILNQEYLAGTIASDGDISSSGDVTFTAEECITLTDGFSVGAGGEFWARIMPNLGGLVMTTRDYCGGLEYFESELEAIYFADGRVKYDGGSSEREYILADYQGNSRVLFRDAGNGTDQQIEHYSYYPYGAVHEQQSDYSQKYLFGGKELQTELDLGWSDFGVRCFDNWSAKWQGIDIMSEVTPQASPYGYTLGNPVRFSDPSGMISEDEDGMMHVSTDLWGGGRNQDFMKKSASNAQSRATTTRNRQAGYIDTGGDNTSWLSDRKLASDKDTYTFDGKGYYSTEETGRELSGQKINIFYAWYWTGQPASPSTGSGSGVGQQKNSSGFTPVQQKRNFVHQIGFTGTGATGLGGMMFSTGYTWDDRGNQGYYFTFGSAAGFDASLGWEYIQTESVLMDDSKFDIESLNGIGINHNVGRGYIDAAVGGDARGNGNFGDVHGVTYKSKTIGFSFGLPIGYSRSVEQTGVRKIK